MLVYLFVWPPGPYIWSSYHTYRQLCSLQGSLGSARRGIPATITSNNGSNFLGANKELGDVYCEGPALTEDEEGTGHLETLNAYINYSYKPLVMRS